MNHYFFRISVSLEIETNFSDDDVKLLPTGDVLLSDRSMHEKGSQIRDLLESAGLGTYNLKLGIAQFVRIDRDE